MEIHTKMWYGDLNKHEVLSPFDKQRQKYWQQLLDSFLEKCIALPEEFIWSSSSVRNLLLIFFSNFQTNHLCWSLFLDKLLAEYQQLYKIGTPAKDFSCVFYEIFNNFFFAEHLRVTHFTLHRIVFLRIHDGVI